MIIRRRHTLNFTTITNRLIEDRALSYEALGVLCYLLSRPHNWQVHLRQLSARPKGGGRDRMRRIFNEIIKAGYATRELRRHNNRITGLDYVVTDEPQPQPISQETDFQAPENPAPLIKKDREQDLSLTSLSTSGLTDLALETEESFESALRRWQRYRAGYPERKRESIRRARRVWLSLSKSDRREAAALIDEFWTSFAVSGRTWPIAFGTYLERQFFFFREVGGGVKTPRPFDLRTGPQ